MPVPLRSDFEASQLCAAARKTKDAAHARRLLALAAIYDGASPTGRNVDTVQTNCARGTVRTCPVTRQNSTGWSSEMILLPASESARPLGFCSRKEARWVLRSMRSSSVPHSPWSGWRSQAALASSRLRTGPSCTNVWRRHRWCRCLFRRWKPSFGNTIGMGSGARSTGASPLTRCRIRRRLGQRARTCIRSPISFRIPWSTSKSE
jgi:hypothetical protein